MESKFEKNSVKKNNADYKKPLPVWLRGLFSPCGTVSVICGTVVNFFIFEYLQRQKYISSK